MNVNERGEVYQGRWVCVHRSSAVGGGICNDADRVSVASVVVALMSGVNGECGRVVCVLWQVMTRWMRVV